MSLAAIVIAGSGVDALRAVSSATDRVNETALEAKIGARLNQDVLALNRGEYHVGIDPSAVEEVRSEMEARQQDFREQLAKAKALAIGDVKDRLDGIARAYDAYMSDFRQTLETAETRKSAEMDAGREAILESVRESRASAQQLRDLLTGYVQQVDGKGDRAATQAADTASAAQTRMIVIAALGVLGGLALGILVSRGGIVTPLRRCVGAMKRLADGDLDTEIYGTGRGDEIGEIAEAMQTFKEQAREAERLRQEQAEAEKRAEEEKRQTMNRLADRFESEVGQVVETVGANSEELNATAQSMSSIAEETSRQSQAVASASEQASTNVETAASAAEELSTSINEISEQINQSSTKAQSARRDAENASTQVASLNEATDKIGDVVQLIQDIAEQTNLLALNATIEAARAGDAGKGFAVVAQEVKNLAEQTTKATDEISQRIHKVQGETKEAVSAIERISAGVREIDESAASVASAIEQQNAAMRDISRNVQEASSGTQEVSKNITSVSQAAGEAGSASEQVVGAVGQLNQQAATLRTKVASFVEEVRAA